MASSSLSEITLIPEGPCSQLENLGISLRGQSHQSIQEVRVMSNRAGGGRYGQGSDAADFSLLKFSLRGVP